MVVTGRGLIDSTQNTTNALTASKADQTVGVASGPAFAVGEEITIDYESTLHSDDKRCICGAKGCRGTINRQ